MPFRNDPIHFYRLSEGDQSHAAAEPVKISLIF